MMFSRGMIAIFVIAVAMGVLAFRKDEKEIRRLMSLTGEKLHEAVAMKMKATAEPPIPTVADEAADESLAPAAAAEAEESRTPAADESRASAADEEATAEPQPAALIQRVPPGSKAMAALMKKADAILKSINGFGKKIANKPKSKAEEGKNKKVDEECSKMFCDIHEYNLFIAQVEANPPADDDDVAGGLLMMRVMAYEGAAANKEACATKGQIAPEAEKLDKMCPPLAQLKEHCFNNFCDASKFTGGGSGEDFLVFSMTSAMCKNEGENAWANGSPWDSQEKAAELKQKCEVVQAEDKRKQHEKCFKMFCDAMEVGRIMSESKNITTEEGMNNMVKKMMPFAHVEATQKECAALGADAWRNGKDPFANPKWAKTTLAKECPSMLA